MSPLVAAKRATRALALEQRAAARRAHPGAAPAASAHMLGEIGRLDGVGVVSGYLPIRDELDPMPAMLALRERGHRLCVPVIEGRGLPLAFREWLPESPLVEGPFGVTVPAEGERLVPGVLIVPMLAFDLDGHRLGYGGGYYDRTIAKLRGDGPVHAFGYAYAGQAMARLPAGETDMRLDAIVTEAGVTRFG